MKKKGTNQSSRLRALLGSRTFFIFLVGLFVVQASWIALSSKFPQAFDEAYHLGIIKEYAEQWSPFIAQQGSETYHFGDITRYPSYLYHYLMSFPYRILDSLLSSETQIIILLRFINIAFFVAALVLFRKVLLRIKNAPAMVHTVLAVFMFLPVAPYLASHINYDNLLILWVAWFLLLLFQFLTTLHHRNTFDTKAFVLIACVGLLGTIIKIAFLPILTAAFLVLLVVVFRWWKHTKRSGAAIKHNFKALPKLTQVTLIVLLAVSMGLFVERYGYNTLQYKTPLPECSEILDVEKCSAYPVWLRNHTLAQTHEPHVDALQIRVFGKTWFWLSSRGLFAVFDAEHGGRAVYGVRWLAVGMVGLCMAGLLLAAVYWRHVLRSNYLLQASLAIIVLYMLVLVLQNYADFTRYGIPIAIQGRYLLPILPLVGMFVALGFSCAVRRHKTLQGILASTAIGMMVVYGGMATYILRTEPRWYWDNKTVIDANEFKRSVLEKIPGN